MNTAPKQIWVDSADDPDFWVKQVSPEEIPYIRADLIKELAESLRHKLYGERETIGEAFEYALSVAPDGGIYALTGLHVLLNTIANEIERTVSRD